MRTSFLTTRSNYSKKTGIGGTAAVIYSFFGERKISKLIKASDRNELALIALREGLENFLADELAPYRLQIDSDASLLVQRFMASDLSEDELKKYRHLLNEIRNLIPSGAVEWEFKSAKDFAGKALVQRAEFDAKACVTADLIVAEVFDRLPE